jgi:hypothetical protein
LLLVAIGSGFLCYPWTAGTKVRDYVPLKEEFLSNDLIIIIIIKLVSLHMLDSCCLLQLGVVFCEGRMPTDVRVCSDSLRD